MFHPFVRIASPSLRMGLCRFVPDPNWGRGCVPLEKKDFNGGDRQFLGPPDASNTGNVPNYPSRLAPDSHCNNFRTDGSSSRNTPGSDLGWLFHRTSN